MMLTATARELEFAPWAGQMQQSVLREVHELLGRPGLLSFALGMPAAETFPAEAFGRAAQAVLQGDPGALQYGLPVKRLRHHVVQLMARRGVRCTEDEVFITSGAQQGMSLLGQLLVPSGATVVTEELVYDGMLAALRPLQPRVLTVPSLPGEGMDVDAVEALLARGERPALIYTIPEGHNPLGASMPAAARRRLAALAARHGVPVLEDDAYGLLTYDAGAPPAMRSYDADWVLYLGSFSKIMAPGVRTGWVVAPRPVVQRLSVVKHGSDLDVCTFAQRALAAFLDDARVDEHLARLRTVYAARRDAVADALDAHFPAEARWTHPTSGMFVWVRMPEDVSTTGLLRRSVEEVNVGFVPGRGFCAGGGVRGGSAMRLNFTNLAPAQIHEGIRRLGRVLHSRRSVFAVSGPGVLAG
ncbi:MAG TPA: PLP-dependent aminotransferase family protein [Longimicrobium sp.]|jgi:2-aminoadipate transaminase|uniref:aminotransferase-like domain-containing protein n=1 Tax=Longimicrobium sp. TaxID=2029185 RepID=UPI002ED8FF5D